MNLLRPPQKSRGTPLLQDVHGRSLTLSADDALLAHARIVSEGLVESDQSGSARYNGSTMISIDLENPHFDLPRTESTRAAMLDAVLRSVLLRAKILRLARAEAERKVTPLLLCTVATHTKLELSGTVLRIDVEIESALEDPQTQFSEAEQ